MYFVCWQMQLVGVVADPLVRLILILVSLSQSTRKGKTEHQKADCQLMSNLKESGPELGLFVLTGDLPSRETSLRTMVVTKG